MSNALMCDTCGQIFPDGAEGAISGVGSFTKTIDGVQRNIQQRTDTCPECAECRPTGNWKGARAIAAPQRTSVADYDASE